MHTSTHPVAQSNAIHSVMQALYNAVCYNALLMFIILLNGRTAELHNLNAPSWSCGLRVAEYDCQFSPYL